MLDFMAYAQDGLKGWVAVLEVIAQTGREKFNG
jgi:hypothetical protein